MDKFTELVKMYIDWACAYDLEIEWIDIFRECCQAHVAIEDIAEVAEEEIYKRYW